MVITGDFNQFPDKYLTVNCGLTQTVKNATRERSIVEKYYTNIKQYYKEVEIICHVGKSDHHALVIPPVTAKTQKKKIKTIVKRCQ